MDTIAVPETADELRKRIIILRDALRREAVHVSDSGISTGMLRSIRRIEETFGLRPKKFGSQW